MRVDVQYFWWERRVRRVPGGGGMVWRIEEGARVPVLFVCAWSSIYDAMPFRFNAIPDTFAAMLCARRK